MAATKIWFVPTPRLLPSGSRAIRAGLLAGSALVGVAALSIVLAAPVVAGGGQGGASGNGIIAGGTGGSAENLTAVGSNGNPGTNGPPPSGGGGGGAGGGAGGQGGGGANFFGAGGGGGNPGGNGVGIGSAGSNGGTGSTEAGGGGGGGGGGHGGTGTSLSGGSFTGGAGGNGGNIGGGNGGNASGGGGGGEGGYGFAVTGASFLSSISSGALVGGDGGNGGGTGVGSTQAELGGAGGSGGIGFYSGAPSHTLTNSGTITGGNGGTGGTAFLSNGAAGLGGAGVVGSDFTVITNGTISGGLSGDGVTRASAIKFTGGTNILTLQNGFVLNGNIDVTGTVNFNQTTAQTLSSIITGSGAVINSGTGTLTLSGANTYTGGTALNAGTLSVAADTVLGATSGGLTFNGGTLQVTAVTFNSTPRAITWGANGGGFDIANASNSFLVSQSLTGGGLSKLGAGNLVLTGTNAFSSGINIAAGEVRIGNGGTTGSYTGNVTNSGSLRFNRSDTVTMPGTIAGTGSLVQGGSGTLIVSTANVGFSGTASIVNGALQALNAGALGTGNIIIGDGTLRTVFNGTLTNSQLGIISTNGRVAAGTGTTAIYGGTFATSANVVARFGSVTDTGTVVLANTVSSFGAGSSVAIEGGTLQLGNGGTAGSIANNNVANAGTLAFNRSDAVGFGGVISGTGAVNQIGTGTTTLTAANSYTGLTTVTVGTLALATSGVIVGGVDNRAAFKSAGNVSGGLTNTGNVNANGGTINGAIANNGGSFNVGGTVTSDGAFGNASGATLTLGGAGSYTVQGLLTNSGALNVAAGGTLNATTSGITNTATGMITNAGTIRDDLNNAGGVTNNAAFLANVAGNSGTITNAATGTWTGDVASSTGSIVNNGVWTGSITSSGSLSGTGSVNSLNVTGGSFTPGNGTAGSSMTVSDNLALASGVQYVVQVNPATASLASVGGTATLGGASVSATFANGSYVSKQYTILTAAGGRTGTFRSLANTNLPANFNTSLSYDANNAYLNLVLIFSFPNGLNQNQTNVANALVNSFNTAGGIPMAFASLSPAGLTQVSGELETGTQQTTFDAMGLFMGVMTDPLTGNRGEIAPQSNAPGYAEEALGYTAKRQPAAAMAAIYRKAPPIFAAPLQRWSVWSAGFGGSQTTDGNAALGSNTASSRIAAGAVGLDYRFSPTTLVGIAVAGGGTNFSVANGGTGRSDLFQAGAFVRHTVGPSYIIASLAYGWQDVTTERRAGAEFLTGRFNTDTFAGRVEGGYRFVDPIFATGFTPYVAGQFTTVSLPNYSETAGATNTFGLNYAAKDVTASRNELGLRTDKSFGAFDGVMTLRGRAAWAHNFNPDRSINATFQTLPGASFTVNGASQARDAALVTASAEMKWRSGWAVAATFEGELSDVSRSYAGKGVVRYGW